MKVTIIKYISRQRQKYHVPARYSNFTKVRIVIDGIEKCDVMTEPFGGFKKLVERAKKKYRFTEYEYFYHGVIYETPSYI